MTRLPDLPGYEFRPATPSDVPAMAHVVRITERQDGIPEVTSDERLAHDFHHDLGDPATDSLLAFDGSGRLAAFGWLSENRGGARKARAITWLVVHPEARKGPLADVLLSWLERRSVEVLADAGAGLPRLIRSWSVADNQWCLDLHTRHGFSAVRYFSQMRRDLSLPIPNARFPEGVTPRSWKSKWSAAIRDAHNDAFTDHWGSEPLDEARWRAYFDDDPNFRGDLSHIAVVGDRVVGHSLAEVFPDDWEQLGLSEGWVSTMGVRRSHRRHGLATALIAATMRSFREEGLDFAALGVDTRNPTGALTLYERLGFATYHRTVTLIKEIAEDDVVAAADLPDP